VSGWPACADDAPEPPVTEAGTPHAPYTIVDDASGQREAGSGPVDDDVGAAAEVAERKDRPDVARALRTGRV
jgi:hypothetical protein